MDTDHYDILIDNTQNPIKTYRVYNGNYVEIKDVEIESETHVNDPTIMWILFLYAMIVCSMFYDVNYHELKMN